jgi:D-glycero-alpha-D-manno-heptose-7-phosphate kinase
VYINIHRRFTDGYLLKYSHLEEAQTVDAIKHPIVRECLRFVGVPPNLEITSMADIPAGTGLGSSGSFTTSLLKALHCHGKTTINAQQLAEEACHIELDVLREPIGKQDQFIAAYGGITCLEFARGEPVRASKLQITDETLFNLEDNLLLFFTGYSRSASAILKEQDDKSKRRDQAMVDNLHFVKELGYRSKAALEAGDLMEFGRLMDVHWQHKKQRSGSMSNADIDGWYATAMDNGAVGGKLIGAGGGGFLMFYAADKMRLRHAMRELGLREVRFRFDFEGAKILASD